MRLPKRISPLPIVVLILAVFASAFGARFADASDSAPRLSGADTIFLGGDVVTVADSLPKAEAVAVRGGKIMAVGTEAEILLWKADDTEIVDLAGATLLPGLIEVHTHPLLSMAMATFVDVSGFRHSSADEVMATLRAAIDKAAPGAWVRAYGWDPALVHELRIPTLEELDALAPENPLFILTQTMHTAFVNSLAYTEAGITKDTPQPKGGGTFHKDEDGELTGMVTENSALAQFTAQFPQVSYGIASLLLSNQFKRYAAAGYTSVAATGPWPVAPQHLRLMQEVAERESTPARLFVYPLTGILETVPFGPGIGGDKFRVLGVKMPVDGSPYAGGMAMDEPYLENEFTRDGLGLESGTRGHLNYSQQEMNELVEKYHRGGWQIATHVQGERAIEQMLDAYELVLAQYPRADHRHRLEHCALITPAQLERAARLGVTVSFYIDHIPYYGRALERWIVGPERASRFMPMGEALRAGHRATFHTDNPSSPLGPFRAMQAAATRKKLHDGEVLGPDQRISVEDGIKALTINAAWQVFAEDRIGSIEVGKEADFTVVSENPLEVDPDRLGEIEIVATYLSGRVASN